MDKLNIEERMGYYGLRAAEKTAGFNAIGLKIPIDSVDVLQLSIRQRKTLLSRDPEDILHQMCQIPLKIQPETCQATRCTNNDWCPLISSWCETRRKAFVPDSE